MERSGVEASRVIEDAKRRTQHCPSSSSSDMARRVVPSSASHCSHKMPTLQAALHTAVRQWPSWQRHNRGHHYLAGVIGTIELEGSGIAGSRAYF